MDALKILMLEDNPNDAEVVRRLLLKNSTLPLSFLLVDNRAAYVEALHHFRPQIILADNSLPQFNATEAIKILRAHSPLLPFILITGTVSEEFAAEIIKLGADDYILKDRLARLPAAIDAAIKQRRSEKEKEDAIQRLILGEENYRKLVERVSDGFISLDKNWRYTYANKKISEMTRKTAEELIGKNIWEVFPEAVNSKTYLAFHKAMSTQTFITHVDYFAPLDLWQENTIYPSPDGLSVFIKDISEKIHADVAVRNSEQMRSLIMNSALDAIICCDEDGKITVWNPQAERLFGRKAEEVKGLKLSETIIPVEYRAMHEAGLINYKVTREGPVLNKLIEITALDSSGNEFPIEMSIVPITQENGYFFCAFIRDITDRKKIAQELQQSYTNIRYLASHIEEVREEEKTSIAREIHDELGQQLTGYKMDIAWLNKKLVNADQDIKNKLHGALELIDETINTVRRIATSLRPSILDDLGLIAALEWQSEEFQKRAGTPVYFTSLLHDIQVDPKIAIGIFRIYQELLTNVARHASATNVESSLYIEKDKLYLSVIDNGKGYSITTTANKKTLGLLGIRERTQMMQGTYDVTSTPGSGTSVLITIPLKY